MGMQPQATASSAGTAAPGSLPNGPFEGPLTFLESGLQFLKITRAITLQDAISQLGTGGTPAQGHAYLLCEGDLSNVVGTLFSGQIQPGSANRSVPTLKFAAGQTLIVKAVQLSGGAAEATQLILRWA